ncbi:hypothetical protein DPMN_102885 [Dreissena polymorpha]|uniref:Uncharacterized protein n=1 Tax=Dreissena polymorpha TaxID=45954 RepID=A0A9D4K245_DREPO|nr:hypothetical protein DPMN_102885 [Dreissena polymorpha]
MSRCGTCSVYWDSKCTANKATHHDTTDKWTMPSDPAGPTQKSAAPCPFEH